MRFRIPAFAGTAAVIVVAVLLLSGGSSDSSLAQAAGRLNRQSVVIQFTIAPLDPSQDSVIAGTTATSADGRQTRIAMNGQVQGEPLDLTTLKIGNDVWVASSQLDGKLPDGKRWIHGAITSGAPPITPAEFTEFLREASDVSKKGQSVIRGRRVTEYAGTFSAKTLAERADALQLLKRLGDSDMSVPIQAFLDDQGRPMRLVMTVDAGDAGKIRAVTDIIAYGKPVSVQPPPVDQTVEEADVKTS